MKSKTYKAKTVGPIFYSSIEGEIIKTSKFISATAATYAIAYKLEHLPKKYVLTGTDSTNPNYSPFKKLPFFVSDFIPISVSVDEHTFRSVSYTEDHNITVDDEDATKKLDNDSKYAFPDIKAKSDSGWQELRHYTGISVGSTFRFTIWAQEDVELPEQLRFELGMKRTGYIVAEETEDAQTVDINQYLLEKVYDIPQSELGELLTLDNTKYHAASEPRLSRFRDIPKKQATKLIKNYELYKSTN